MPKKILNIKNQKGLLDYFTLIYNRSIICTKLGYDDLAIKDLELSLRKDPTNQALIENLAIIHRRNNNLVDSYNSYKKLWNLKLEEHNNFKEQLREELHIALSAMNKQRKCPNENSAEETKDSTGSRRSDGVSINEEKKSPPTFMQTIERKKNSNSEIDLNDLSALSSISFGIPRS